MLSFLALSVSSAALASEPVLVPEFATASPNDFVVTTMVQNLVVNRLVSDGHIVLTSDVAGRVVSPDRLMACGPSPTCPQDVLPQVPARLAVVVTTNRTNGALTGHVELYLVGQADPAQAADVPVTPGNESLFAAEVSRLTAAMLQQIGPSPDGVLMAAAQLIAGQPVGLPAPAPMPLPVPQPVVVAPAPVPVPQPVVIPSPVANTPPAPLVDLDSPDGRSRPAPAPVPTTTRVKNGDGSTPHEGPLGPILEGTGVHERHLLGSEGSFRKSGLDPRDWMYRAMPHAGRMVIQLSSGLAMGDVERSGVFLIERTELVQSNSWYQEGPSTARRVRGDLFVGYAPATMFDFGVQVGLQYGARNIITGFVERDALGEVTSVSINQPVESQAVQFYIQPRVRGYLVPLGPAKPYLFTGADLRVFNSYDIDPDNDALTFIVPEAGVTPGWIGGGGLMIDPSPIVGLFAEGSYTQHFGERAVLKEEQFPSLWEHQGVGPTLGQSKQLTVVVSGGVQFRL
jgi:hypothetical protein